MQNYPPLISPLPPPHQKNKTTKKTFLLTTQARVYTWKYQPAHFGLCGKPPKESGGPSQVTMLTRVRPPKVPPTPLLSSPSFGLPFLSQPASGRRLFMATTNSS